MNIRDYILTRIRQRRNADQRRYLARNPEVRRRARAKYLAKPEAYARQLAYARAYHARVREKRRETAICGDLAA